MQDLLNQVYANPLASAAGLCAAGAVSGYFGLVVPTTLLFLLAGLVLMIGSGPRGVAADTDALSAE